MAKSFNSISDFNNYMKSVISLIVNDMLNVSLVSGNETATVISERIRNTGKKGDGKRIGKYSPFTKRIKNKKGQENSFVNLTDTGDMWKHFKVIENNVANKNITTVIGGQDEFTNQKLTDNTDRYKDFLGLTKKEEKILAAAFDAELQIVLDKYF